RHHEHAQHHQAGRRRHGRQAGRGRGGVTVLSGHEVLGVCGAGHARADRLGRVVRGVPDTFFLGPAGAPSRPPAALHGRALPASVKQFVPAGRRVTMPLSLEQYAAWLDKRDLHWPAPPAPDPVKAKPHLVRLPEVRAVLWNVYGTLLNIAGGELWFE